MTICLFPLNRVDPALTVSYPDYGSWSDHISYSGHVELDKLAVLSSAAQMINMIQTVSSL